MELMLQKWLVWGTIPSEYILAVFSTHSLRRYMEAVPRFQLLLRLPQIEACSNARMYARLLERNPKPLCREYGVTGI